LTRGPALSLDNLTVTYNTPGGPVVALEDVNLALLPGEVMALVGESGSGKSTIALAAMQLLPPSANVSGRICLNGVDLADLNRKAINRLRGAHIGMIFQESMSSLNPVLTIARQMTEGLVFHRGATRGAARSSALAALDEVGIADPERVMAQYPHQLSGGMRQRVSIAAMLALEPGVIIADEPTTALDGGMRARVLDLLGAIKSRNKCAILLITHDLNVVSQAADRVAVIKSGRLVERGDVRSVFSNPRHPHTISMLASRLTLDIAGVHPKAYPAVGLASRDDPPPKLVLDNISQRFGTREHPVNALKNVSLMLKCGETLGIVGESGSGKTTLGRIAVGLDQPTSGRIYISDQDARNPPARPLRKEFLQCQMVFQDPHSSLNARLTVARQLGEPIFASGVRDWSAIRARATELFRQVGLSSDGLDRYPHEFSGGQRQRIAIARALAANPQVIVADEPVSSLETATQVQILDLLKEVGRQNNISYIFISHDIAAVARICDRIAVLQHGRIVELAPTTQLLTSPSHPYTMAMLDAAPRKALNYRR
jgi:peptide/nickel transport system ATP-binding protein